MAGVRETGGTLEPVNDGDIRLAVKGLASQGLYVEDTSGAAPTALDKLFSKGLLSHGERVVVPITGSGLKT